MLIGVYGTLKKGKGLHKVMENCEFKGDDYIFGSLYHFENGNYPIFVNEGNDRIKIEIYEVDDEKLKVLDKIEGHPKIYERTKITTENNKEIEVYTMSKEKLFSLFPENALKKLEQNENEINW